MRQDIISFTVNSSYHDVSSNFGSRGVIISCLLFGVPNGPLEHRIIDIRAYTSFEIED